MNENEEECPYLYGEECDHSENEGAECPCGCPLREEELWTEQKKF